MQYRIEGEIKARMKAVGLNIRDLANLLHEPPGTVGNRLNGYIPLTFNQRRAILEHLKKLEARKRLVDRNVGQDVDCGEG